jgi:hypothetical protein
MQMGNAMAAALKARSKRRLVSLMTVSLLGPFLSTDIALADNVVDNHFRGAAYISASRTRERSGTQNARTKKPSGKPGNSGNFIYEIINDIQARSKELCAHYGSPGDCLEEAEVCLTMRDPDDNQIKLCLNTIPGESGNEDGKALKSRLRR